MSSPAIAARDVVGGTSLPPSSRSPSPSSDRTTAPVFKRRSRPRGHVGTASTFLPPADDQPPSGRSVEGEAGSATPEQTSGVRGEGDGGGRDEAAASEVAPAQGTEEAEREGGGDQDDEPELSIADLLALRSLQRRPGGIDLARLNEGDARNRKKKKKKKAGAGGADGTALTEEQRWEEQMRVGGLVTRSMGGGGGGGGAGATASGGAQADSDDEDGGGANPSSAAAAAASKGGAGGSGDGVRLVKPNNFQGETNAVDVDKHMMEYIETEMARRRAAGGGGGGAAGGRDADAEEGATPSAAAAAAAAGAPLLGANAEDELYRLSDRYRAIQEAAKEVSTALGTRRRPARASADGRRGDADDDDEDEEGNLTLSSAMLSSVQEIDLGMQAKLRNIEETERARRRLEEQRRAARSRGEHTGRNREEDEILASARFFRPTRHVMSDSEALKNARSAAAAASSSGGRAQPTSSSHHHDASASGGGAGGRGAGGGGGGGRHHHGGGGGGGEKREVATDQLILERFKKRQRAMLKR